MISYPRVFIFARSLSLIRSIISDSAEEGMVSGKYSRKVTDRLLNLLAAGDRGLFGGKWTGVANPLM